MFTAYDILSKSCRYMKLIRKSEEIFGPQKLTNAGLDMSLLLLFFIVVIIIIIIIVCWWYSEVHKSFQSLFTF